MNTLEFTYRTYKTFVKAVPTDSSVAGFHFLKQSINREYPKQETRMLQLNGEMLLNPASTGHEVKFLGDSFYSVVQFHCSLQSIKGRVERDCLNSKHSILSVLLARFGLSEYNVARMGNKQSYTLLLKPNGGLYHTS